MSSTTTDTKSSASLDTASTLPSGLPLTSSKSLKRLEKTSSESKPRSKQHVALKILTADSYGQGSDIFELDILKHIRAQRASNPGANHVLGLLDDFEHCGPNGNHVCLVFKAMGPTMARYRHLFPKPRVPLPLLRDISKQLLTALSFLHDTCRVIHTGQSDSVIQHTTANFAPFLWPPASNGAHRHQTSKHTHRDSGH